MTTRPCRLGLLLTLACLAGNLVTTAQTPTAGPSPQRGKEGVKAFTPVTDAMMQSPAPEDWLHWRRTLDGWGYSPLNQITRDNVHRLQLVWSAAMGPGLNEPTPLVYNGVMYVASSEGLVQAFDAVTGDSLWEYRREFESPKNYMGWRPRTRSIAIYDDKIYYSTPDAHIVALDARTGAVAWDHAVADWKLGYRYSSGPIVVRGRIVAGMTGCDHYKNDTCFISAHDARSGKEIWRTSTIARPGEPGGDTWGDLPLRFRAGGDAWIPGSFDPTTNLIYWPIAQAKPWARVSRGTDGDVLYTNSTLALDPETGRIVWHHQYVPGETHDLDATFENILIDHAGRKSLFTMGKIGVLWEIDRTTGSFVAAHDLGYQTVLTVDPKTGAVAYFPNKIPKLDEPLEWCPGNGGVRNWRALSYHPGTHALYIPITDLSCFRASYGAVEQKDGVGGYAPTPGYKRFGTFPHPKSPDHKGGLAAVDIATGKVLWQRPTKDSMTAAALTTAGGLAVVGNNDRYLYVHDAASGTVLFQARLPSPPFGFPITYAVRGRQYLAVPTGSGASGGNAVYVFALPAK